MSLMRDVEAHWIGRVMSAERRPRERVDSIARRIYGRRREVGKGTPVLGLRDEPNARTWHRGLCSLHVRRLQEGTTRRIHKCRRQRDSHTPELGLGPIVIRTNNTHFNAAPRTLSLELGAFWLNFHEATAYGQLRNHSRLRSLRRGTGSRSPALEWTIWVRSEQRGETDEATYLKKPRCSPGESTTPSIATARLLPLPLPVPDGGINFVDDQ